MIQKKDVLEFIKKEKLIAIVRGVGKDYILDTAEAICNGGIHCLEITIDHETDISKKETYEKIKMVKDAFGERLKVGAGTVMSAEEVDQVIMAGAEFIISPDTNENVIKRTVELNKISIPGAFTPSEIARAYEAGADFVKLFPAGLLGTSYIKAVKGPLKYIPLMAVGGVTLENGKSFLEAGCIGLGIGGDLVRLDLIYQKRFKEIEKIAADYVRQIQ